MQRALPADGRAVLGPRPARYRPKSAELIAEVAHSDELNTIIVVTHDIVAALEVADTIWLMGRDRAAEEQSYPARASRRFMILWIWVLPGGATFDRARVYRVVARDPREIF